MNRKTLLTIVAVCLAGPTLSAQDYPMKPTAEHDVLKADIGVWDFEMSMWFEPDGEPLQTKGEETVTMFGHFWAEANVEYDFMGQKIRGHQMLGYDAGKKKYIGSWRDSGSPYLATSEGDYDAESKTMTMQMKGAGPDGKPMNYKTIAKRIDEKTRTYTMFAELPTEPGKFYKNLEIKYTKRD